ncbi:LysE family translocator [Laceyella putida]|uniref:LysE family translocator n=1 Tax=Laceyella putida TaxID=110101 RepID=A0ABW2RNB1_9BACL
MNMFFAGFALSLSLCLDLGTVNIAIMRTGMQHGMWLALWIGFGSGVGDLVYALLSTAGMAALLQYKWVRLLVWLGGSTILLVLCVRMIREAFVAKHPVSDEPPSVASPSSRSAFMQGVVLALSSPSSILWFAAVGGSVIAATNKDQTEMALFLFFAGFFLAGQLWSLFLAILTSWGGSVAGPKLVRTFSLGSALLFLYFAVKVFMDGAQQFL